MNERDIIPSEVIEKRIFIIRGYKVMLDFHIAELYQVETKTLKHAVQVNIAIMRSFVKLREVLATHKDLVQKLAEMEKKYDAQFQIVFCARGASAFG